MGILNIFSRAVKAAVLTCACVVFGGTIANVQAGVDEWTPVAMYGGLVPAVAVDPATSSIVYIGTAGGGVFKSTDSGQTWTAMNSGLDSLDVQAIAIDRANGANTVYAGTATAGIFRSTDGGATWTAINDGLKNLNVYSLAINRSDPQVLYAGTFGNLFQSLDGGNTWTTFGVPTSSQKTGGPPAVTTGIIDNAIYSVMLVPNTPNSLYVATHGDGVYKFDGATWLNVFIDPRNNPNPLISNVSEVAISTDGSIVFAATQGLGLYTSTNSGTTWTAVAGLNTALNVSTLRALAMLPSNTNRLYAGASSGFFYSTNGGTTWTESATELDVLDIAIDPNDVTLVYAGTHQGIFKSTDGGVNFTAINTGVKQLDIRGIVVNPSDPSSQFAAAYPSGVLSSSDSGATWTYFNTGLTYHDVSSLAIDAATQRLLVGTFSGGVFKRDLTGATAVVPSINWTSVDTGLSTPRITSLATDSSLPGRAYAGSIAGMLVSTNGGDTWTPQISGITGNSSIDVSAIGVDSGHTNNDDVIYSSTSSSGIFKGTLDSAGAIDWNPATSGLTNDFISAIAVLPGDSNTLYVGTLGAGIFKSTDAAATWIDSSTGLTNKVIKALIIDASTPTTLYAATTTAGIFKSVDAGANWFAINTGLDNLNINALEINTATTPPTLLAGTNSTGIYAIQSTATTGSAAQPLIAEQSSASAQNDTGGGGGAAPWLILLIVAMFRGQSATRSGS